MNREYATAHDANEVMKSAVWLAWIAAGGPQGMGFLQDNPTADKDRVWDQAYNMKDYGGRHGEGNNLNADYVFGRMLKLHIRRESPKILEFSDSVPRYDYQSWCRTYKTYAELFDAAEKDAGVIAKVAA